jgi:SAM-dependent methyltransferase
MSTVPSNPEGEEHDSLEVLYESWSRKTAKLVEFDIRTADSKARLILSRIPPGLLVDVRSILDFGCGYGSFLSRWASLLPLDEAIGVDYSERAIAVAAERFGGDSLRYSTLPSLDAEEIAASLRELAPQGVGCVLLIDLLEHVPDCRKLMSVLSRTATLFVVKLPLENTVLDNYVRRKEFPSSTHSNGHLREFTVNDVHYFVRALGLTPLYEDVYAYSNSEMFPPAESLGLPRRLKRALHWAFRATMAFLLPRRAFLRLVGGGGYFCLATYDALNILEP